MQLWHGLLLVIVLAGFGFTAWQLQCANQMTRVDHELEQRMGIISGIMRPRNSPPAEPPPPREFDPPGRPADHPPAPPKAAFKVRLSARELSLFEGTPGQAFYYVVWPRENEAPLYSASTPADIGRPEPLHGPPHFRSRGTLRECFHNTPSGECVLIGRDIQEDLADAHRFAWLLAGTGGTVLLLGLAGGGWIAARALRPISAISDTATRIATGDLTQRIHTPDTESELGQLARDLNHTFARLQTSFERQAQFTADASHELRTPVAVVLTQTQAALARERPAAEYRESLGACQRAAQRMRGLIESLLTLARLDATRGPLSLEPCELDRIVGEVVELLLPLAKEHGIELEAQLTPTPCAGNAGQLAQVAHNLISNALFYNRPGGLVRVAVCVTPDAAILSVSDTGLGISPDDLPHLFERFYRADKARSGAQGHSGLGLAITQSIVQAHGGTIGVTSEPGQGSTFEVRLPALVTRKP